MGALHLRERSKQIGEALRRARERARRSVRECSAYIGTAPRRYTKIEQGTVHITAVELEALVQYLDVPAHEVWPMALIAPRTRSIMVNAEPGESVHVVVNIAASPSDARDANANTEE
ncbi:MAG: helix-turn-helix domain-containing protein [Chloroflexota bacterium]|nr:helix-turn-helix domain-containing protein [Chloroflexota bacterium]